ncbi:GNAT family N-acetyltransferase [Thalassomonas haliotis]|uniref:GNAT family N-acetyltransferase n=1 Tax=Thalassomonas haliotis TaxID=485448 RepID=A0ABY7VM09_9GAMM|nr:GNAT family N-acetyltransferase [Thalassomonas haliotis]WDE13973.1 GNAT family N-acetyltransferase [Thalassomonas haliotis]
MAPQYQGQGLGQRILQQVLQQAKGKTVLLTVLKENPALNLYKKLGFTVTGEDEYEFHMQVKPGWRHRD